MNLNQRATSDSMHAEKMSLLEYREAISLNFFAARHQRQLSDHALMLKLG